jgi:hypothetical protein
LAISGWQARTSADAVIKWDRIPMILAVGKARSIGGWLFIVAGVTLFAVWTEYIVWAQARPDLLDVFPLALAILALALGVWLAPVGGLVRRPGASVAVSIKGDLFLSLAVAVTMEIILGPLLYYAITQNPLILRLERLQEPGAKVAYIVYAASLRHLGRGWGLDLALGSGFLVLVAMWTCGTFAVLSVLRLMRRARSGSK